MIAVSPRFRIFVVAGLAICVAGAALAAAAVNRERIWFVGKCWGNGNPVSECSCTFSALGELPENYRGLAVSWAHDTGTAYAGAVMYLVAAEAPRVTLGKKLNTNEPRKTVQAWVWNVVRAIGWAPLRKAAPAVAANLAPAAAVVPVAYDAGTEFTKARSALDRHCRGGSTFMTQVNETRDAAEKIAREFALGTMELATDTVAGTVRESGNAAARLWAWARSWVWN